MIFVLWVTCFVILPVQIDGKEGYFRPKGPDAFMRLERVDTLVQTGNWYDGYIPRTASGKGADIHWTRPMDILILATASPLFPLMDMKRAIEMAGTALPAVMSLLLVIVCIWAVTPLMQPSNLLLIVILLAVQPIIQNYFGIGRVDHHMVLAVLMAGVLGCLIRLGETERRTRLALLAGALSGLGIWISLEFLIVYVPVTIGLGVCWLLWGTSWRKANRDFALATLIICIVAIAIDVSPDQWPIDRYDRISIAQVFLVFCSALFWFVAAKFCERRETIMVRLIASGIYAFICLVLIDLFFANLFVGPLAEADPRIGPIWLEKVSEMAPVITSGRQVVLYCLLPFAGIIYGAFVLSRRLQHQRRQMWVWLVLVLFCTGALALAHVRAGLYLSVAGVIAAGPLLEDLLIRVNEKFKGWKKGVTGLLVRIVVILGPFLLAFVIGSVANGLKSTEAVAAVSPESKECDAKEIAEFLSDEGFVQGRGVLKFVNNLDYGPELVYRTPHHFLAVPYHRNGQTIFDTYTLLTATEFGRSRELLNKYGIDYILICPNASDKSYFQDSDKASVLYNRLVSGDLPEELVVIDVPKPWKLFQYRGRWSE